MKLKHVEHFEDDDDNDNDSDDVEDISVHGWVNNASPRWRAISSRGDWTPCDQQTELLPIATKSSDALRGRCTSVANIRAEIADWTLDALKQIKYSAKVQSVFLHGIFEYFTNMLVKP